MSPVHDLSGLKQALPFWISLLTVPVMMIAALVGGWAVLLPPLFTWILFDILDTALGTDESNADPGTADDDLYWYRLVTLIWFPVQFLLLCWLLWYVPRADHLGVVERIALFFGMGIITGAVGIVYAHELMHQKNRLERWLADLLLATVLYSHFRSEHLRVHHLWVGTPRDAVSARYNEGFHGFFGRVLRDAPRSAFLAERMMLGRRELPVWHLSNPFWTYAGLQAGMLLLALMLGGWQGLALFIWQAVVAIWQLELVNYIEHYGLTRRYLGEGRYEHVLPRHSWNSAHMASNWFLINLQRHSDHHYKPDRRFPLLQTYDQEEAPQLPHGYPLMAAVAMVPPLWRRVMNPKVRDWRRQHYPDVADWKPYNTGSLPMPKGSVPGEEAA